MLNKSCCCARVYRNSDSSTKILICNDILMFCYGCKVHGPCLGEGSWRGDVADLFCDRGEGGGLAVFDQLQLCGDYGDLSI